MIINILGGGPIDLLPNFQYYNGKEVIWVGVDRGVHTLLAMGIQPTIAFGDFDSVSQTEFITIQYSVSELSCLSQKKTKPIWNMP